MINFGEDRWSVRTNDREEQERVRQALREVRELKRNILEKQRFKGYNRAGGR